MWGYGGHGLATVYSMAALPTAPGLSGETSMYCARMSTMRGTIWSTTRGRGDRSGYCIRFRKVLVINDFFFIDTISRRNFETPNPYSCFQHFMSCTDGVNFNF